VMISRLAKNTHVAAFGINRNCGDRGCRQSRLPNRKGSDRRRASTGRGSFLCPRRLGRSRQTAGGGERVRFTRLARCRASSVATSPLPRPTKLDKWLADSARAARYVRPQGDRHRGRGSSLTATEGGPDAASASPSVRARGGGAQLRRPRPRARLVVVELARGACGAIEPWLVLHVQIRPPPLGRVEPRPPALNAGRRGNGGGRSRPLVPVSRHRLPWCRHGRVGEGAQGSPRLA
jgi:hypothetical protein